MRIATSFVMAAIFAMAATNASAKTWEKCFSSEAEGLSFVSDIENFSATRVALKPVENDVFKNTSLSLSDMENLFGPAKCSVSVGSIGDKILTWIPLVTRSFSATALQSRDNKFCTYVSARSVHHELRATVDVNGTIVHKETRKTRSND